MALSRAVYKGLKRALGFSFFFHLFGSLTVNIQDLNGDGVIQVVDVVILLDLILSGDGSSVEPCSQGDFNGDGKITVQVRRLFFSQVVMCIYMKRDCGMRSPLYIEQHQNCVCVCISLFFLTLVYAGFGQCGVIYSLAVVTQAERARAGLLSTTPCRNQGCSTPGLPLALLFVFC